jgi:N-acylneuraminate cytidylyltransferase
MSNLAIIPARGGSKRIPRKNIKEFLGKPVIAYTIEAALMSGLFEEVMVSTDDEEIKQIAGKFGARVPFYRSAEASNDYATTMDVIREVVDEYKNQLNREFDLVCCLYPTAPLIRVNHLVEGLNLLRDKNLARVFPVVPFGYPVWRGLEMTDEGKTQMIWPEYQNSRSQDLRKVYHDAGQWYWIDMKQAGEAAFTYNTATIILSEEEVQDIDTLADWKMAEIKYNLLHET